MLLCANRVATYQNLRFIMFYLKIISKLWLNLIKLNKYKVSTYHVLISNEIIILYLAYRPYPYRAYHPYRACRPCPYRQAYRAYRPCLGIITKKSKKHNKHNEPLRHSLFHNYLSKGLKHLMDPINFTSSGNTVVCFLSNQQPINTSETSIYTSYSFYSSGKYIQYCIKYIYFGWL